MYSLWILGAISFLLSLGLTPLARNIFAKWGVLDKPDHVRKFHGCGIPRVGGVPLALSYVAALLIALVFPIHTGTTIRHAIPLAIRLLPAAGLIFAVGLIDDVFGLPAKQKLGGQILASIFVLLVGIHVESIGGHPLPIWVSVPVTIIWLVGCANAVNLIDGLDGLAAGVGLFAATTALIVGLLGHNFELAIVTVPLVGSLLGFLCYNFNPASIFLGDSGSLLIGFLLGCFGILWSEKSATVLGMTAPLIALSIPLMDVGLAVVRRFLRQQPIFGADRGHIHHKLLARGLTPRRVALVLYMACTLSAVLALLQSFADERFASVIVVLCCVCVWMGIQYLGYVEFGTAGQLVARGAFRHLLNAHIALASFEDALKKAHDVESCWEVIEETHKTFGFSDVESTVNGVHRRGVIKDHSSCTWSVTIYLNDDYVRLYRLENSAIEPALAAHYAECIRKVLLPHLKPVRKFRTAASGT